MASTFGDRMILIERTLRQYAELTDRYEAYLEQCQEDREKGYRPHYCEHGTNQWTDYDNICGHCEDGHHLSDLEYRWELAVSMATEGSPGWQYV